MIQYSIESIEVRTYILCKANRITKSDAVFSLLIEKKLAIPTPIHTIQTLINNSQRKRYDTE